jgi:signal transduction histidine kinase
LRLWRETYPGVVIETSISPSLGARGETAELTIYRVIQEALTNVFRHARATRVDIAVEPAAPRRTGTVETEAIRVSVRDNGAGLPTDHKQGFGMLGMRGRLDDCGLDRPRRHRGGPGSLRDPVIPDTSTNVSQMGRPGFFPDAAT